MFRRFKYFLEKVIFIAIVILIVLFFHTEGLLNFTALKSSFSKAQDVYNSEQCQNVISDVKKMTSELLNELIKLLKDYAIKSSDGKKLVQVEYLGISDEGEVIVKLDDENYSVKLKNYSPTDISSIKAYCDGSFTDKYLYLEMIGDEGYLWTRYYIDTTDSNDIDNYCLNNILKNKGW